MLDAKQEYICMLYTIGFGDTSNCFLICILLLIRIPLIHTNHNICLFKFEKFLKVPLPEPKEIDYAVPLATVQCGAPGTPHNRGRGGNYQNGNINRNREFANRAFW